MYCTLRASPQCVLSQSVEYRYTRKRQTKGTSYDNLYRGLDG